jgi:hypothetical protein
MTIIHNGSFYLINAQMQGPRRTYTNNKYDWYTTTIHQTKYSRWNINNCGAGTLGQEKRYMYISVHTLRQWYWEVLVNCYSVGLSFDIYWKLFDLLHLKHWRVVIGTDTRIPDSPFSSLGQEKRYMYISVHTLTHIYMRGGMRENIYKDPYHNRGRFLLDMHLFIKLTMVLRSFDELLFSRAIIWRLLKTF